MSATACAFVLALSAHGCADAGVAFDGAWVREASPVEYSVGFDAATARRI